MKQQFWGNLFGYVIYVITYFGKTTMDAFYHKVYVHR